MPPQVGDLTKQRDWLNVGARFIETKYEYDSFGNQRYITDPLNHTTEITYDSVYQSFPIRIENALSLVEQREYYDNSGAFGQIESMTNYNGHTTTYEYDTFGRQKKVVGPYDSGSTYGSVATEYGLVGSGQGSNFIRTRETEEYGTGQHLESVQVFDGYNRLIQASTEAESADFIITTTQYNNRGLASRVSVPTFGNGALPTTYVGAGSRWTEYTYDPMQRITQMRNPDATTVNITYQNWKQTVKDENGHDKRYQQDGLARLVQVEELESGNTFLTQYTYDPLDRLNRIQDYLGNAWIYTFDSLGRKISESDPDLGPTNYVYDDNNNLTQKTNARNISISYQYDALNRMKSKDHSDTNGVDVTFNYDEGDVSNGKGQRTRMTDPSGEVRYYYDNEFRVIKEEHDVVGLQNLLTVQWVYDAKDRIKDLTYPNGKTVHYNYNDQGLTDSINGFITNADYTALGQENQINFSNGRITTLAYRSDNQRLSNISTNGYQNQNYAYDLVGNITRIYDNVNSWDKSYGYDHLNRLLTGDGQTYVYNPIGNLISKNGQSQQYNSSHPHALTFDGVNTYAYDATGNMLSGNDRQITYDAENRPAMVERNDSITYFTYDGDGKRKIKTVNDGSGEAMTVYVKNLFEKTI